MPVLDAVTACVTTDVRAGLAATGWLAARAFDATGDAIAGDAVARKWLIFGGVVTIVAAIAWVLRMLWRDDR